MDTPTLVLIYVTAGAHLLSAFRLACYPRNEGHYCWRVGLLTSLCGGVFCVAGMDVLLAFQPVSPWHALLSVLLCVPILRCSGNIVFLWRTLS